MFTSYSAELYPALSAASVSIPQIVLSLVVLAALTAISVVDIRKRRIPDLLNLALLVCGVAALWIVPSADIVSRLIGLFCVSVPLFIFAVAVKHSFGMGDVKLMAAAGFLLGWQHVLTAFAIGTILGGVYGAVMLILRKKSRTDSFAFGPCLAAGIFAALIESLIT
ncbi:MAG: A24 family peptidase [Clostridiales Family XIII bacterium]|jgi:leader peptidase (prepilin peptidase)/N-methyltransferase|nr:A24 family peptidase [Clostridiales Family XIII bacterium]